MKTTNILYWVFTGLFAAAMVFASYSSALMLPEAIDLFKMIQLPAYLVPFTGWAKLVAVAVILIPGFPRLKEWAYAGLFIDLVGATYCFMMTMPGFGWLGMLMFIVPGILSYYFYHKRLAGMAVAGV